jgi:hypothetical protein
MLSADSYEWVYNGAYLVSQLQQLAAEAVNGSSGLERHFESSGGELGARYKTEWFDGERGIERSELQQWHVLCTSKSF